MKKRTNIFLSILLGVLFVIMIALFLRPYLIKEKEETEAQISVKPPKQLYELGENMNIEGVVWNVSEAELIEDYEKIDSYYKEREFLLDQEEYIKEYMTEYTDKDLFAGDIRYFRIKCSVTNTLDNPYEFSLYSLIPTSIVGSDMVRWYFDNYDVRIISSGSENEDLKIEGYKKRVGKNVITKTYDIQPKKRITVELIGQLSLCDIYPIYDLQYSNDQSSRYELYLLGENSTKRIRLNLSGEFGGDKIYQKARNIQAMKYQSWTNLEQMAWEKEGREKNNLGHGYQLDHEPTPIAETEEAGQEFFRLMYQGFSLVTTLKDFKITEWKGMPSDFAEQGNLQKMAKRYSDVYNCREDELKVLVLDVGYTSSQTEEITMNVYERVLNYFYGKSKLYVKDENNELWLFGTADSWIVTENSAHPENIGSVNFDIMELDADISI